MTKICPHCQKKFECRNDNVLECDCVHVILSREALDYISSRYNDCLCVDCLREINRMPALTEQNAEAEQDTESECYAESKQYDMENTLITNNH
jgi:hypothetical protein